MPGYGAPANRLEIVLPWRFRRRHERMSPVSYRPQFQTATRAMSHMIVPGTARCRIRVEALPVTRKHFFLNGAFRVSFL